MDNAVRKKWTLLFNLSMLSPVTIDPESEGSIILYKHNSSTPNRLCSTESWMLFCVGLDVHCYLELNFILDMESE